MSSARAVGIIKKITGEKRVGHMGTLDVEAEGVLPVAFGKSVRLFDFLLSKDKIYETYFEFGRETDTLDYAGNTVFTTENIPDFEQFLSTLPSFTGELEQIPPKYSALKINGKCGYDIMRQGGDYTPKTRKVNIYSFKEPKRINERTFAVNVHCSAGTYIRSLVRDVARAMNSAAVLSKLVRIKSGCFELSDSARLAEIEKKPAEYVLPSDFPLLNMPKRELEEDEFRNLRNGIRIKSSGFNENDFTAYYNGKLYGIVGTDSLGMLFTKTYLYEENDDKNFL